MNHSMSYPDWIRAQGLLAAIRQRLLVAEFLQLHAFTDEARRALEIDRDPAMAGFQLDLLIHQLDDLPALKESVRVLASWLVQFDAISYRGERPQQLHATAS